MKTLKHNQQVRVESFRFQKKITVYTQKGYFGECDWKDVFSEKKDESYAYTIQEASCLTADYKGKAEEMLIIIPLY